MGTITINGAEIRLAGKFTTQSATGIFNNTPKFTEALYYVDLQAVDEIDSAGLALLLYWQARASTSASRLEFSNPPDELLKIAEVGGLTELFRY